MNDSFGVTAAEGLLTEVPDVPVSTGRSRRRWWLTAAASVSAVVLIVGLVAYLHWRSNARELFPYGGVGGEYSAGQVDKTFYEDAAVQPRHNKSGHEVLDLRSIRPLITVNTAHAVVTMLICVRGPGNSGIGSTTSTRPYCESANVFRPGPVDLGFPVRQVIFAVTARRPGIVRIEGCQVYYKIGSRSGNQHAGSGFVDHVHANK